MQDELEALRNEITKKNRDQLDMMYNLDMDNFSDDTKALFKQWSDGANDVKTYFQTYIDSNEAKWTAYSEWKTSTSTSLASLEGRVTANESSITSLTQWKSEATNSIASISQKANANESSISSLTYWKNNTADGAIESISAIRQTANSASARIDLLVNSSGTGMTSNAASIIMEAINDDTSSIKISADKIRFSGESTFVTAGSLGDSGSTIVSGNRIRLHMLYSTQSSTSALNFTASDYESDSWKDTLATIKLDDGGSGTADSARYSLYLRTMSTSEGNYPVAIKLRSKGSMSLESDTTDGGIYIDSLGYLTMVADYNVRVRASGTYSSLPTSGTMSYSSRDYIFCTDGIYYNGVKILST